MGLGKSVLTIAAVEDLIEMGEVAGGLLIMPSSLKYQWQREISKFTGGEANVLVIDGSPKQRLKQYEKVMAGKVEYTILNYEQVVNDWNYVKHLPRDFICLDEAVAIKNFGAKRTKKIKQLTATYRWALTGQPVENKAEEIFSIMEWVDPTVLGDFVTFDQTFIERDYFGQVRRYQNLPLLHKLLDGAMARKTWDDPDVRDQMPRIVEESILVDFEPAGAKLYRHIVSDLFFVLSQARPGGNFDLTAHYQGQGSVAEHQGAIMSRYLVLRMLCDHPELIRISAGLWDGSSHFVNGIKGGSEYASDLVSQKLVDPVKTSPKLKAAVELIQELLDEDPRNKIVLFSFFKHSLALIGEATAGMTEHALFTGDLSAKEKDKEKQRFQTDPNVRLFLSSDAGGYGVDLPQANYLISFDLPWSAGAWDQRNSRIIRLSTEWDHVTLISIIMAGSIEERQLDALAQKQSIGSAIVDAKNWDKKGGLSLTLDSLTDFLNSSTV